MLEEAISLKKWGWRDPAKPRTEDDNPFSHRRRAERQNTDTENKGFDGDKLISGIQRPIGVDTHGLPHTMDVTTADVTDSKGQKRVAGF